MENKNLNIFRYVSGGLFVLSVLYPVIKSLGGAAPSFTTILAWVAWTLMAAAMFTEKYALLAVGAGIRILQALMSLISMVPMLSYSVTNIGYVINTLLAVVGLVLILLASVKRDSAKTLGIVAAAVTIVGRMLIGVGFLAHGGIGLAFQLATQGMFVNIVLAVAFVFAGFAMHTIKQKPVAAVMQTAAPVVNTGDRIEKLMKLKALLDSGVLTQEEFDAKKKSLLDM